MSKIDWKRVWDGFDAWYLEVQGRRRSAGYANPFPDWPAEQMEIQRLVEAELKRGVSINANAISPPLDGWEVALEERQKKARRKAVKHGKKA